MSFHTLGVRRKELSMWVVQACARRSSARWLAGTSCFWRASSAQRLVDSPWLRV